MPPQILDPGAQDNLEYLDLGGYHSLSRDVLSPCRLLRGVGIIGWVAKHRQPIHVSPFEHDSRTLGMYKTDQHLKSFIGIPIPLEASNRSGEMCGVLGCDSKKAYAFSKLQSKLLQDLSIEIAHTIHLTRLIPYHNHNDDSWSSFLTKGQAVVEALGAGAAQILRAALINFSSLENSIGTGACVDLLDQVYRLIQQVLPPHFPCFCLPSGDVLIIVDNMMSAYYENKITAIASRITHKGERIQFKFYRRLVQKKHGMIDLEEAIRATSPGSPLFKLSEPLPLHLDYEYRRA